MQEYITRTFGAQILQWDEPSEDGFVVFSVYLRGELIVAYSAALLWSALQERAGEVLVRAA